MPVKTNHRLERNGTRRSVDVGLLALAFALTACDANPKAPAQRPAQPASDSSVHALPPRSGYADVDGGRVFYQVYGDLASGKTPLLILHGSFMTGDGMMPLTEQFVASRPVITIDQRGHGHTGDLPGAITYEMIADDAARVLESLHVSSSDVLGYSMGGTAAVLMALRHPEKVGKQVILSGTYRTDGWNPGVVEGMKQMTPASFAGSPLEAEYKKVSPTPNAFPTLVEEVKGMETIPYHYPEDKVRAIAGKTMIVVGDADGVELEHALALFKLRGGVNEKAAAQGFLTESPRARLAILPATSHLGILAQAKLIAEMTTPFLDDAKPVTAPGFLPDESQQPGAQAKK